MDEDAEVTLIDTAEETSNPHTEVTDARYQENYEAASIEPTRNVDQNVPSPRENEQIHEMAEITKTPAKTQKSSELDKFKRRLIRAIARLINSDQTPTEEIWEELKKQSGCDCKLLWNRMRTLTIKKLRRLFTAEDKIVNITKIAQLTVTDWLLFDLVLVHENIDVIGQDLQDPDAEETPKVLEDLFATVVVYDLERLTGDALTKAWFEATAYYNGTERQCSPMLLQRRWYQMKATVREKIYQFWYSFRGSQRQLAAASEFKPTNLEMEIVKLFKYITTDNFPTWEELIQQKKVSLPEDFERLQLAKRRIFRTETGPDLEVIEPQVETIDLDQDSDSEASRDSSDQPNANVNLGIVKVEKVDEISDDDDDVRLLESESLPLDTTANACDQNSSSNVNEQNVEEQRSKDINNEEDVCIVNENYNLMGSIQFTGVTAVKNENLDLNLQSVESAELNDVTGDIIECEDGKEIVMPTISTSPSIANFSGECDEMVMPKISNVIGAEVSADEPVGNDVNSEVNEVLESFANNITTKNVLNSQQATDNTQSLDTSLKNIVIDKIGTKKSMSTVEDGKDLDSFNPVPNDINLFDGIELEDDGIEYVEEEGVVKDLQPKVEIKMEKTDDSDCPNTPTIDLKLLLTPVVYTKNLNDMDVFRFIDYNSVKDKRVLENAENESKPIDRNSVKMEEISQERLSTPNGETYSGDEPEYESEIDSGPETIDLSSWLLNKPRKLSYNPIQLCKNPDFNTRLKRLSAGFFSSERNRYLLKECKPLTIDLHKSFENKLINNTLYLSGTKSIEHSHGLEGNAENTNVVITTSPHQNLVDILGSNGGEQLYEGDQGKEKVLTQNDCILDTVPFSDSSLAKRSLVTSDNNGGERKKVINLPDIDQIRRLNERLLTAEVSPIQVFNNAKPPLDIISVQPNLDIVPSNNILLQNNDKTHKGIKSTLNTLGKMNVTSDVRNKCDLLTSSLSNYKKASLESNYNLNVYKGNSSTRVNTQQQKIVKEPKKPVRVVNRVEVSWNPAPRTIKNIIPQDRLLTSDTVDKILNICKGDDSWLKNTKAFKKAFRKKALYKERKTKIMTINKDINQADNEVNVDDVACEVTIDNEVSVVNTTEPSINQVSENNISHYIIDEKNEEENIMKNVEKETINKQTSKKAKHCCWAREKIVKLSVGKKSIQRHKCPRPLCDCCCRQELVNKMFAMNIKRDALHNPKAQAETNKITKPIKINISSQYRQSNLIQKPEKPRKVSVGINTDFDAEFEIGFATNLAEYNKNSEHFDNVYASASAIKLKYGTDDTVVNGQTQTCINLCVTNKNASTFSSKESNSPSTPIKIRMVSEINESNVTLNQNKSLISPVKPIILHKNNLNFTVKSRCIDNLTPKTATISNKNSRIHPSIESTNISEKMLADVGFPKIAPKQLKSRIRDLTLLNSGEAKIILEEKREKMDKVLFLTNERWKNSRTPICLGKHKILLCSFPNTQLNENTSATQCLNGGPNSNCVQNTVPVALPDGVRIVLLPNKELALSIDPGVELNPSQLAYLPTLMASVQQQLAASDKVGSNATGHLDPLKDDIDLKNSDNATKFNSEKEVVTETSKDATNTMVCNEQLMDDSVDVENNINKTTMQDNKKEDNTVLDKSNASVNLKDDSDLTKKTILSDLMEMSGISAEDTRLTNHESPPKRQLLSPTPLILQSQIGYQHNETFMNNDLFDNPVVKAALNRFPDFNIVFSYTELRYASENNAQFFKMDIQTGVIMPINLVIKKQLQGETGENSKTQITISKSVIDLTDDPEDDETISIDDQSTKDISTAVKDPVVPVKLFAVRPSNLQRGQSLLVQSVKSSTETSAKLNNRKMVRIIQLKRKRKEPTKCVESINLDSDNENNESSTADNNTEPKSEKKKSGDDSDSDDEPLAFKAKRMKESTEVTEGSENLDQNTDTQINTFDDNHQSTELVGGNAKELTEETDNVNTTKTITNKEYIHPTPQLEPVVFEPMVFGENMPESSDEDCILGV